MFGLTKKSELDAAMAAARNYKLALGSLQDSYATLRRSHDEFKHDLDTLILKIMRKGGLNFLENAVLPGKQEPAQFSRQEIDRLVRLCHPDKHNNSTAANEITQKLLKLRAK